MALCTKTACHASATASATSEAWAFAADAVHVVDVIDGVGVGVGGVPDADGAGVAADHDVALVTFGESDAFHGRGGAAGAGGVGAERRLDEGDGAGQGGDDVRRVVVRVRQGVPAGAVGHHGGDEQKCTQQREEGDREVGFGFHRLLSFAQA